jgi:hypothetical protein
LRQRAVTRAVGQPESLAFRAFIRKLRARPKVSFKVKRRFHCSFKAFSTQKRTFTPAFYQIVSIGFGNLNGRISAPVDFLLLA